MKTIDYRKSIIKKLQTVSDSPQSDSELLLMHALNVSRTTLLLRSQEALSKTEIVACNELVQRRLKGEPIAYILGKRGFWTMDLIVTPDTLIPRPETECVAEWVLNKFKGVEKIIAADLGTGTGAIALTLASENNTWQIDATDESFEALAIAKKNVVKHNIKNVSLYQGDWCAALPSKKYDVIVSNPPYIAQGDIHLEKLQFEPQQALVSGEKGLDAIEIIAKQAGSYLKENGYLVIEHGFDQAENVCDIFKKNYFIDIQHHRDLSDTPRFVTGRKA